MTSGGCRIPGRLFMADASSSAFIRVHLRFKYFLSTHNHQLRTKYMAQAIGMIETRGLVALVEGTDAMLKAANVELVGPMTQVGNALVTAVVVGDVAAVKAATDAGAQAIKAIKGEVVSVHVIARPHADVEAVLPKKK